MDSFYYLYNIGVSKLNRIYTSNELNIIGYRLSVVCLIYAILYFAIGSIMVFLPIAMITIVGYCMIRRYNSKISLLSSVNEEKYYAKTIAYATVICFLMYIVVLLQ